MIQSPTVIYKKLDQLEKELQQLKLDAYFALPAKTRRQVSSAYAESALLRAARDTRQAIWQKRYAKRIARLS